MSLVRKPEASAKNFKIECTEFKLSVMQGNRSHLLTLGDLRLGCHGAKRLGTHLSALSSTGHSQPQREGVDDRNHKRKSLIDAEEMASERSRLNPVFRLIRKKELQLSLGSANNVSEREERLRQPKDEVSGTVSVIKPGDLVGERSRLNPVYRMIRRKELRLRYPTPPNPDDAGTSASESSPPAETRERRRRRIDTSHLVAIDREGLEGKPEVASTSMIGDDELASEEAKMNPVFRLIRKKELKKRFLSFGSPSMNYGGLEEIVSGFDPYGAALLPDPLKDVYLSSALDPGGDESKTPSSNPVFLTGNPAVDRTIRIRQIVMRLRKESKSLHALPAPSIPQVPWLLLENPPALEGRSIMSQSQNDRLLELRESKKKLRSKGGSNSLTLVDKALGVAKSSETEWKQQVARNLNDERYKQLEQLQRDFPRLELGRLLGLKLKKSSQESSHKPAASSSLRSLLKLLDDLGVPSDKAISFASKEVNALIQGGRSISIKDSDKVGAKLSDLSSVLGGVSMEESLKFVSLQPSSLNRNPETLESNISALEKTLRMSRSRVYEMVQQYPPLMEMNQETVKKHLSSIQTALLSGQPDNADLNLLKEAIYSCPGWLGMKTSSALAKIDLVRHCLRSLYSSAAKATGIDGPEASAIEDKIKVIILGYPQLLCIGRQTLESKFQRLEAITCSDEKWAGEIMWMKPKSLGRILGAGPAVLSRLEYFIETGESPSRPVVGGGTTGRTLGLLKIITLSRSEFASCFPRFVNN